MTHSVHLQVYWIILYKECFETFWELRDQTINGNADDDDNDECSCHYAYYEWQVVMGVSAIRRCLLIQSYRQTKHLELGQNKRKTFDQD